MSTLCKLDNTSWTYSILSLLIDNLSPAVAIRILGVLRGNKTIGVYIVHFDYLNLPSPLRYPFFPQRTKMQHGSAKPKKMRFKGILPCFLCNPFPLIHFTRHLKSFFQAARPPSPFPTTIVFWIIYTPTIISFKFLTKILILLINSYSLTCAKLDVCSYEPFA